MWRGVLEWPDNKAPPCYSFPNALDSLERLLKKRCNRQNRPSWRIRPANNEAVRKLLKKTIQTPSDDDTDATTISRDDINISLLDGIKTIAVEADLWISGGGMHESVAPSCEEADENKPRVYNSHVIIDNQGNVQAIYRKTHLFDVSIPGKVNLQESATTAPGTKLVVCDSPIGM